MKRNNKGITLVSLVITIIVMLILAGVSLSMVVGENSVLEQASRATITKVLTEIKEGYEVNSMGDFITSKVNRTENKAQKANAMGDEIKKLIPTIPDNYIEKVAVFNGNLVFISKGATEEEKQIATELGYLIMEGKDFLYMSCMYKLSKMVLNHAGDSPLIGARLGYNEDTEVIYGGIVFGHPWYRLTVSDLDAFPEYNSFTNEEKGILRGDTNDNIYVVNYTTGEVLSKKGFTMYEGTIDELHVYSFNYSGSNNEMNLAMDGLLSGINGSSVRLEQKFGEMIPATEYASSGVSANVIEDYYKNDYTYDEYGGVVLGLYTDILSMPIDQTKEINKKFSINITFKADLMTEEQGKPEYGGSSLGGCLLAISDVNGQDVCSVRIRKGKMTVITFSYNGGRESDYSLGEKDGYAVIDIKQYDNKFINLNIVSERGGQTKVYINGNLISTFDSGNQEYTYQSCTIGDLRSGRGMKFMGSIYNFGLYGVLLSETQVAQNWEYTKYQLNTNEAGTVVPKLD